MTPGDYNRFSLEDFLTDEFFRTSVRNPTRESTAFWNAFAASDPPNKGEYRIARKCLESSDRSQPALTEREIDEIWHGIAARTVLRRPEPLHRRPFVRFAAAAAASLVLFFAVRPLFDAAPRPGISEYALATADTADRQQAQLILSDEKTVVITDKKSEITYDEAKITVSREEIPKKEAARYNRLIIPKGKMSKLTLSDGTRVWVNANTRIVYPAQFSGKQREIYVDGEVFLDVVRDSRPFVVRTKELDVEVTGTRFNVCAYDDREQRHVVLVEGAVKVRDREGGKTTLEPDQMYRSEGGRACVAKVDVRKYASWIEGLYYFDRERLDAVARRLSDYYGVPIACDGAAGGFTCSGKLDLTEHLDEVLHGLCRTMPVVCERTAENEYVLRVKQRSRPEPQNPMPMN